MKIKLTLTLFLLLLAICSPGCIAFPPLIQVEHKHEADNQELMRRLDAIDQRLDQLEKKETK